MKSEQITLVQNTFTLVEPIAEAAAGLFYNRLFELDPSLRRLFKSDIKEQGKKLMQALAFVVKGLSKPERIIPVVEDLGRRHVSYGVEGAHYDTVGAALLWTLEQGLGAAFTPEVEQAWAAAYGLLAEVMQEAAAKVVSAEGTEAAAEAAARAA